MKSKIIFAILPPTGENTLGLTDGTIEIQPGEPLPRSHRQKSTPNKKPKVMTQQEATQRAAAAFAEAVVGMFHL